MTLAGQGAGLAYLLLLYLHVSTYIKLGLLHSVLKEERDKKYICSIYRKAGYGREKLATLVVGKMHHQAW